MQTKEILVRYSEIGLKSENIRENFEQILRKNIIKLLNRYDIDSSVSIITSRLLVKVNTKDSLNKAMELLKKVAGIASYSPIYKTDLDITKIEKLSSDLLKNKLKEFVNQEVSFAVRSQRGFKDFIFTSVQIDQQIGGKLNEQFNIKVDLKNPKILIGIDILPDNAYVFIEKVEGMGGLPVGSQGKVLCLLSDGIDSPVAVYMMIKRGCNVVLLHLKKNEVAAHKVDNLVECLKDYDTELEYIVHDYNNDLQTVNKSLKEIKKDNFTCIFCKKMMQKIAEKYAEYMKCEAIVNGDNLGQVASQTLENMRVISMNAKFPILRPLIGFDKLEIKKIAQQIGTYELSIQKSIDCSFLPRFPKTFSSIEQINGIIEKMPKLKFIEKIIF